MSICLLEVPIAKSQLACPLARAEQLLAMRGKLGWEHVSLCSATANANHCSHGALLNSIVAYVRERSDLFEWATDVVIEAQPAARMKIVAAGLFASVRFVNPGAKMCFQSAKRKLAWGMGLAEFGDVSTYRGRKRAAVALLAKLLRCPEVLKELGSKKDDAADSFLHALNYAATGSGAGRRRLA